MKMRDYMATNEDILYKFLTTYKFSEYYKEED